MDYMVIFLLTLIITVGAEVYLKVKYSSCLKKKNKKQITGVEAARKILDQNGLQDVGVVEVGGFLSDHYDPRSKVVRLSKSIYEGDSIASVSVAAHECGHAIQDKEGYFFLRFRSSIIPIVNFASFAGYIAIVIGLFAGAFGFLWLGIFFEAIILLFQLITLPVEFNASHRGILQLKEQNIIEKSEISSSQGMLFAAALTYVASVATSLLEILRLILMANNSRRD